MRFVTVTARQNVNRPIHVRLERSAEAQPPAQLNTALPRSPHAKTTTAAARPDVQPRLTTTVHATRPQPVKGSELSAEVSSMDVRTSAAANAALVKHASRTNAFRIRRHQQTSAMPAHP